MATIEGGNFQCYKDGFETASIEEWNEHCSKEEGSTTHITEEGTTACTRCGVLIEFTGLPYQPIKEDGSKSISLTCPDCSEKTRGSATIAVRNKEK